MSASKRLKALGEAREGRSPVPGSRTWAAGEVMDALPQIVAVVEAAERLDDLLEMVPIGLALALAALDEALQ